MTQSLDIALQKLGDRKSHLKATGFILLALSALNLGLTEGVDHIPLLLQHSAVKQSIQPIQLHQKPRPQHYKEWVYPKIGGGSYTLKVPDSEIRMWGLPVHPVSGTNGAHSSTLGLPRSDIRLAGFASTRAGTQSGGYGGRPIFKPHRPMHFTQTHQPAKPTPLLIAPPKPVIQASIQATPALTEWHVESGYGKVVDGVLALLSFMVYSTGLVLSKNIKNIRKLNTEF